MFETQLEYWKRTPLATNTQPDFSRVGNSELLDCTVRTHNWIRTDTIFIENEQIEPLRNGPPWAAAISNLAWRRIRGFRPRLQTDEGLDTHRERHRRRPGRRRGTYWSLWNFHNISASSLRAVHEKRPDLFDRAARRIGYRIRPSWDLELSEAGPSRARDWPRERWRRLRSRSTSPHRLQRRRQGQRQRMSGLGVPMTRGVRQAMFPLPQGTDWRGCDSRPNSRSRDNAIRSPGPAARHSTRTVR